MRSWYKQWIEPLMTPRSPEKLALIRQRWSTLDDHLKLPQQTAGIYNNACGATHGIMEKCNFACTSCYLTDIANHTEPLPFNEVCKQLDMLREHLGPAGKAQITAGEVTLLAPEELGDIVAYARRIGLDPMVMTNGQRFLQLPDYLPTLVEKYGLEKVSIHIDNTQKGRRRTRVGVPEADLHPVRDQFAELIRSVRRRTGKKLQAAQTVTVNAGNFHDIPEIMRWILKNTDSFRMISFQPVAEVGRTRDKRSIDITLDSVWAQICAGVGQSLNSRAMYFGHPQCNIVAPVMVVAYGDTCRVIEAARQHYRWDARFFNKFLRRFGGFTTVHASSRQTILKILSMCVRNVDFLLELPFYGIYRLWGIRSWLPPLLWRCLHLKKIRLRPLAIVVHQFMSSGELDTPEGRERLAACVFKVPVDGRMVSMCEVNGTDLRLRLNQEQIQPSKQSGLSR